MIKGRNLVKDHDPQQINSIIADLLLARFIALIAAGLTVVLLELVEVVL